MKPVIALVGRPNVGKSTLFNVLTRSRDALVADYPGLTRDRKYGTARSEAGGFLVVDTGGLSGEAQGIALRMAEQTQLAIQEADAVVLLVDGRQGLTGVDQEIAETLRRSAKPLVIAVNKTDGVDPEQAVAEFYTFGNPHVVPIAAAHGRGIQGLLRLVLDLIPVPEEAAAEAEEQDVDIRAAFIGRPNVGKSTLINRLLGDERLVTFDRPGTTRDSVAVPYVRDGRSWALVDTAGVRRRSRVDEGVEKFSVIKSLQAAEAAHVVVVVVDAREGVTEQDASLLGLILEQGRALVVAVNKWDGLSPEARDKVRRDLDRRLSFLSFAERHMISALHGSGVGHLLGAIERAHESAVRSYGAARLTRVLEDAVGAHPPPLVRGRRIKLRYAHQGGHNPPVIVIHGNQTERLPDSYRRYLMNAYRQALGLVGTPVRLEFRTGENPYAGQRNRLTPRQRRKRERMLRHVKGR